MRILMLLTTFLFVSASFGLEQIVIQDEADSIAITKNSIAAVIKKYTFTNGFPYHVKVTEIQSDLISGTANTGIAALNYLGGDYGKQFSRRFWRIKLDVQLYSRVYQYSCKLMRDGNPQNFTQAVWAIKECKGNMGHTLRIFGITDHELAGLPVISEFETEIEK